MDRITSCQQDLIPSLSHMCLEHVTRLIIADTNVLKRLPLDLAERIVHYMLDKLQIGTAPREQLCTLKVRLLRRRYDESVFTIRVNLQWTVRETIRQILSKKEVMGLEPENFGLFEPSSSFRNGRWLQEDISLIDYDLKSWDVLDFKLKHALLKVRFLGPWEKIVHPLHLSTMKDKTVKIFRVDESKSVKHLASDIAVKLDLTNPEMFGLRLTSSSDEFDVGRWLDRDLTLPEQQIDPLHAVFLLKRQFFFDSTSMTDMSSPKALHFSFCQCLDSVVGEIHPCRLEEAIEFAALHCQICYPRSPDTYPRMVDFLPEEYAQVKDGLALERSIRERYARYTGYTEDQCKQEYIVRTSRLSTFGSTFFNVKQVSSIISSAASTVLLGVGTAGITLLSPEQKTISHLESLSKIRQWEVQAGTILKISLHDGSTQEFLSCEAEALSQVLSECVHYILREHPSVQRRWSRDYDSIVKLHSMRRNSHCRRRISVDSLCSDCDFSGAPFHKSRLYVETSKLYRNPLFEEVYGSEFGDPKTIVADCMMQRKSILKIIKILAHVSRQQFVSNPTKPIPSCTYGRFLVRFCDGKALSYDFPLQSVVANVAQQIGFGLGMLNPEEFSLKAPAFKERWLDPNKSLGEQLSFETGDEVELCYRKKFHYNDVTDQQCTSDPVYFNLVFHQWRKTFVGGNFMCSMEEAIPLAATLFQIHLGDHNPDIHKPGFLKPQDAVFFLPSDMLTNGFVKIERLLYKEHGKLRGIRETYAKFRFLRLCRSLKTYGTTFFPVKPPPCDTGPRSPMRPLTPPSRTSPLALSHSSPGGRRHASNQRQLLGFSRSEILIMDPCGKLLAPDIPLDHLFKWSANPSLGTITFLFGDYSPSTTFSSDDPEAISQWLSDYIDFVQTKNLCTMIRRHAAGHFT